LAKTLQVRIDDDLKDDADALFASLGLDTTTAVRMFLVASIRSGTIGFLFNDTQPAHATVDPMREQDHATLRKSIAHRQSGGRGVGIEEFDARMQAAIARGAARHA